jgi:acyl carrier protein
MEKLKEQLKEIIVRDLKLPDIQPAEIDDEQPLFEEGLGLDSLDAVELVMLIQKNFDVQMADMDEGKVAFQSINALAKFINDKQNES